MKLFNHALLERQAWRLIQFSDSLCVRLLKAKCSPNGDIIDTVFTTTLHQHGGLWSMDWNLSSKVLSGV
jgi:hypothetical protein